MCGDTTCPKTPPRSELTATCLRAAAVRSKPRLRRESGTDHPVKHLSVKGKVRCAWGLVPSWAKDLRFGARCINARIGDAGQPAGLPPAFVTACLVPVSAFFRMEGTSATARNGDRPQDQALFGLAGLWERWFDPTAASPWTPNTIVTTAATKTRRVHIRMPVIVAPDRYGKLAGSGLHADDLFVPVTEAAFRIEAASCQTVLFGSRGST